MHKARQAPERPVQRFARNPGMAQNEEIAWRHPRAYLDTEPGVLAGLVRAAAATGHAAPISRATLEMVVGSWSMITLTQIDQNLVLMHQIATGLPPRV